MSQEKDRLLARKAKIEARLAAIAEAEAKKREKIEARRAVLAGRAVLGRARKDEAFGRQLRTILDAQITGARNRALFDLPPASSRQAATAKSAADSAKTPAAAPARPDPAPVS